MIKKLILLITFFAISLVNAQQSDPAPDLKPGLMDNNKLHQIISKLDPEFTGQPGYWQILLYELNIIIVTDEAADRMRIMIPIKPAQALEDDELYRLMQANFDSALDARYAIAQDTLWATYIHPLSQLDNEQFISGMSQTINIVKTYGKSYSSGALTFGGGDSEELLEKEIMEELLKRGDLI